MLIAVPAARAHLPFHHLRWQVIQRPAQRLAPAVGRMHAPPKVSDLDGAVNADQEILWFDVTVNHMLGVAILQRLGQRSDVPAMRSAGSAQRSRWLVAMLQHRRHNITVGLPAPMTVERGNGAKCLQPLPEVGPLDPAVLPALALVSVTAMYDR